MVSLATASNSRYANDADLLRRFVRDRDDLAFGRIMARHARAVRRVAYGYVHNTHAAEDVSQAAFLVLAKRPKAALRSARRRGSCLPWLAKVARYAAANWYRADRLRRLREREGARPDAAYDPTAAHDLADAVRSALRRLSRRERRIVEWRHVEQLSWNDVARRCGTTPDAARKAGSRALASLREVLERRGITASGAAVLAGLKAMTASTSSHAAVATTGATAAELASGVITMLKLQTAAVTTAALLATAGLVATAAALLQDDAPPPAQRQAPAGGLSGTLSDGTTVTLLAMGDQDGNWWTPDGAKAVKLDQRGAMTQLEEGQIGVSAAFRIERADGTPVQSIQFVEPAGFKGMMQYQPGHFALGFPQPAGTDEVAVTALVPVGEPTALGNAPVAYMNQMQLSGGGVTANLSPLGRYKPYQERPEVTFVSVYVDGSLAGSEMLFSLEMKDGQTYRGQISTTRRGTESTAYTVHFGDVPLDNAKTLVVLLQPLESVRFENLAATADSKTRPTAAARDHAATAAAAGQANAMRDTPWLREPLDQPLDLDQVPLEEVIEFLRNATGEGIVVDYDAVDRTTEISLNVPAGVEVGTVLRLIVDSLGDDVALGSEGNVVTIGAAGE